MLLWIIAAMLACVAFGLPIFPVLILGALLMSALAYFFTRDKRIFNLAACLVIVACTHYILGGLLQKIPDATYFPIWIVTLIHSDALVGVPAIVVMFFSAWIGIFGPIRDLPKDMDGVMKLVKDSERKKHDSTK